MERLFAGWGFDAIHARRLLRWYYDSSGEVDLHRPARQHHALPKALVACIEKDLPLSSTHVVRISEASDGTVKLLVSTHDGALVESVLMPDFRPDRAAGCISTQVGCAMACDFCATGLQGFSRNLSAGEIVEQFLHLKRDAKRLSRRLSTIVLMGMGEPLLNLENVVKAIGLMASDEAGHLGWRQITLSTVGLVPQLRQFVDLRLNVQLALSLHAPDDETRKRIIPMARRYRIADLLELAQEHQANTGRVTTIQYCLLEGVNDSDDHARALATLLAGRQMHVNLLTYNSTGQPYRASSPQRVDAFINILRDHRLVAHTRRSRGDQIAAACGQLTATKA